MQAHSSKFDKKIFYPWGNGCGNWVHCKQKNQLGNTVPTQQALNWSELVKLRYPLRRAKNSPTKANCQYLAHLKWYLSLQNSDQFIVCYAVTVLPSHSHFIRGTNKKFNFNFLGYIHRINPLKTKVWKDSFGTARLPCHSYVKEEIIKMLKSHLID